MNEAPFHARCALRRPPWLVLAAVVSLLAALPSLSHADDKARAREHFGKGSKAFDLGAYDEAIAEYSACYRIVDDPALLYNIAQAHRLAGHSAEALRFYRLYLTKVPAAQNRDEVELKIAELQKAIAQLEKTQNMPPDLVKPVTPPDDAPQAQPPARAEPPAARPEATVLTAKPSRPRRARLAAGGAVGGVGLGAAVTGIALSVLAKQAGDDLTALNDARGFFDPAKESAGMTYDVAGPVLLAVGGVALAAGVTLIVIEARRGAPARANLSTPRPAVAAAKLGLRLGW